MISATSTWLSRNADPKAKRIFAVRISGYNRLLTTGPTPNFYPTLGLVGLCGCFTDATGAIIGQPFPIGNGPLTLKVPTGATQLQLGINDDILSGNRGSFTIAVNGTNYTVPGDARPWDWVSGGLNTSFQFGLGITDGTAPVVVSGLSAGQIVTMSYVTGFCYWSGIIGGPWDANGDPGIITGGQVGLSSHPYPTALMPLQVCQWITGIDDISLTVSDLDGGADLSDLGFTILDFAGTFTDDLSSFIFEGATCQLLEGFGKFDPLNPNTVAADAFFGATDYLVRFTGKVDSVASTNNNLEYKFSVPDIRKNLSKIVYQVADDGFPTDQNHLKTISANPIDIILDILENQLGWTTSQIDVAGLTNYRDTIFAGITFEFSIDSPPAAKDFIENEILKPLCGYHWPNNLGVFKVNFFYPLNPSSVATLDHTNLLNVPLAEQADLVDQVTYRFDADADGKFQAESVQNWLTGIAKYGLYGEQVIETAGLRSAFQGYFLAGFGARLIFLRYGDKQLQIEGLQTIWAESLLEPGDRISLTSSLVPDRANGVMGVTAKAFEILDRTWSPLTGVATFKLLEANTAFKQYFIAPNGEPDFTLDTPTNQGKYLYLSDAAGKYSDGSAANTLC